MRAILDSGSFGLDGIEVLVTVLSEVKMALGYYTNSVENPPRNNGALLGWLALVLAIALCIRSTIEPFQMAMHGPPGRPVKFLYAGAFAAALYAVVGVAVCGTLAALHIRMQRGRGKLPWTLGAVSVGLALLSFSLNVLALKYVIAAYCLINA